MVAPEHQQLGKKPGPNMCILSLLTQNQTPSRSEVRDWNPKLIGKSRTVEKTLSDNPCAAARAFPLSACTGLNVIPEHCAPYLFARYLELPPIPHPTSTIVFGLFVGSSASTGIPSKTAVNPALKTWSTDQANCPYIMANWPSSPCFEQGAIFSLNVSFNLFY